jgi:hypothetical protein
MRSILVTVAARILREGRILRDIGDLAYWDLRGTAAAAAATFAAEFAGVGSR